MKLLNLKIKPSGMPNQRIYGHVDSDWVNDLIGQTVQGYRNGMNYYEVGGKPIHIYNATEISEVGTQTIDLHFQLIDIVKGLAGYGEDAWEKEPIFKDGYKKVNSELITKARILCKKNNIEF